jgi:hypothetical protein
MKTTRHILSTAALAVLLCPFVGQAAWGQSNRNPQISELRLQVLEVSTRRDLGYVNPGETIAVPEGSTVRLIMTAMPTGNGKPLYPETVFTDPAKGGLVISRASQENANVTVQVPRNTGREGRERTLPLSFKITESINVPVNERTGTVYLRVVPTEATLPAPSVGATSRSRELVNVLYRGILLREPDESGARNFMTDLERDGYNGLLRAARIIAGSEESRIQVYDRENVSNQQRLVALYKNLLGLSSSQVSSSEWDSYLRQLNSGDITSVVDSMVRSDRFRDYQRLNEAVYSSR